jgi:hypothetical protein
MRPSAYHFLKTLNSEVKISLRYFIKAQSGVELYLYLFLTSVQMVAGGQRHDPAALPSGKRRGSHYNGYECAPGLLWMDAKKRKYLAPLGFKDRTIQPIASCYNDYAVLAPLSPSART